MKRKRPDFNNRRFLSVGQRRAYEHQNRLGVVHICEYISRENTEVSRFYNQSGIEIE
jgi:hypothetical protein